MSRHPDRCQKHPGEQIRKGVTPTTGRSQFEITRTHLHDLLVGRKHVTPKVTLRLIGRFENARLVLIRLKGGCEALHAIRKPLA